MNVIDPYRIKRTIVRTVGITLFLNGPSGKLSLSEQVGISVSDVAKGQVVISNRGPMVMNISVSSQVFSNGVWKPPKEALYKYPMHVLGINNASSRDFDDGSNSILFEFPERSQGELPWRVVVLCQKYYGNSIFGQFSEFIDRKRMKESFAKEDHRGPFDEWAFGELLDAPFAELKVPLSTRPPSDKQQIIELE